MRRVRHLTNTAPTGAYESASEGNIRVYPDDYAQGLVDGGAAVFVDEPTTEKAIVEPETETAAKPASGRRRRGS